MYHTNLFVDSWEDSSHILLLFRMTHPIVGSFSREGLPHLLALCSFVETPLPLRLIFLERVPLLFSFLGWLILICVPLLWDDPSQFVPLLGECPIWWSIHLIDIDDPRKKKNKNKNKNKLYFTSVTPCRPPFIGRPLMVFVMVFVCINTASRTVNVK